MSEPFLMVRAGSHICALPIANVGEIMRAQPVRQVADAPAAVLGLAVIRSRALPVIDTSSLINGAGFSNRPTHFVSVKVGVRHVALAVDGVIGVRKIQPADISTLPPLLSAANRTVLSAIAEVDDEFALVVAAGKLIPPEVWSAINDEVAG